MFIGNKKLAPLNEEELMPLAPSNRRKDAKKSQMKESSFFEMPGPAIKVGGTFAKLEIQDEVPRIPVAQVVTKEIE